jgi:hypothetical protein
LRFGRLARRGQPVVKSAPVVDRLRVGHETFSPLKVASPGDVDGYALGPVIGHTILVQAGEVRSILAITTNYHEFAAKGRRYGPRLP